MEPKTTMKMMGKRREKTTEVGLRIIASKLALEMAKAALNWLYCGNMVAFVLKNPK
jgi:hypothetical protein